MSDFYDKIPIPKMKFGPSAQKVIDLAVDLARHKNSAQVTNDHFILALAQLEWDLLLNVFKSSDINLYELINGVEGYLSGISKREYGDLELSGQSKKTIKLAAQHALLYDARQNIELINLLTALLEDDSGIVAAFLRKHGVNSNVLVARAIELSKKSVITEDVRKRFELPPFLKFFGVNLNLLARKDKIPPVFYREAEIGRILEILCHRERPNSAILIGEAGVGKTATVESLARKIELEPESVPIRLRNCQIVSLPINKLVADTQLRGMFEGRVDKIMAEVRERPDIVIFVDEVHTLMGAGSAMGTVTDASNALKSTLARGEMRIIGATTSGEYKRFIEEDEAMARRFRIVYIDEPTLEEAKKILLGVRPRLEKNYGVSISDGAVDIAIELAPRYSRHLRLPDKVIGWLDTASVRTEISGRQTVIAEDLVDVIADCVKIPKPMIFRKITEDFRKIDKTLAERVKGQAEAIRLVSERLIMSKGLLKENFNRPDGVFLFLGPTGVGKTELAKAIAQFLFGDEKKMIRLDMSEYQEGTLGVEKLIGMPRGVLDSERGGLLTNKLKDDPYAVVLLDEVEKASYHVLNLFLQAFDEGWINDGRGRRVYLSDAIVIMTSNIGSDYFRKFTNPLGFRSADPNFSDLKSEINRELEKRFSPEFRNRIDDVIIFSPLTENDVRIITLRYIKEIEETLARQNKTLTVNSEVIEKIIQKGHSFMYGARFLKRVIDQEIRIPISLKIDDFSIFNISVESGQIVVGGSNEVQKGSLFSKIFSF